MSWPDTIRLSFDNDRYLQFQLLDAENKDIVMFASKHSLDEFDQLSGSKEIPVTHSNFEFLGTLSFNYQTMNVVTEKQSTENAQASKVNASSMTVVNFSGLKGKFPKEDMDLYLKVVSGSNVVKTSVVTSKENLTQSRRRTWTGRTLPKSTFTRDSTGSPSLSLSKKPSETRLSESVSSS